MSDDPSKTLPAVDAMREDWAVIDDLMGGTKAMRAAGVRRLPKWPKEEADAYKERLALSTLLPALSETVQNMTGRVFAEPITLGDDMPESIQAFTQNIDRQGNNLQVWAQSLFSIALSHGLCHVLVDYPKTTDAEGNPTARTAAEEKAAKVRPYVVMVTPQQVIGWRSSEVDGEHSLTKFWYMEAIEVDDGDFGVTLIPQIRVLVPGAWAVYQEQTGKDGKKVWVETDQGTNSLGVIPLATLYTKRTGFMTATPPLLELAHLNVKHWQSQSDQDNILHVARVPMLAISGVDDSTWELKVGSNATKLPPGGDMKWVEHSGKSIEAGSSSLQELVDDMRIAGAKLLQKDKQAVKTATQAASESAQEMSPLQTMAGRLEDALDQTLQLFALWTNQGEGGHVKVNGNFDPDLIPEVSIPALVQLATAGKISDQTLFGELQRRRVLSEDIDWQTEKQRISDQGPALGAL
jgi:hypothetical protein